MLSRAAVSSLGLLVLGTWAVVSTALLVSVRDQLAEQSERLDALSRAVVAARPVVQAQQHPAPLVSPPGASASGPVRGPGLSEMEMEFIAQRVASLVSNAQRQASAPPSAKEHEESKPLAEAQRVALERASNTVVRVLDVGRLTRQDVEQLRGELESLEGRPEADALRRRIAAAINQNKLQPSPDLGPLMP